MFAAMNMPSFLSSRPPSASRFLPSREVSARRCGEVERMVSVEEALEICCGDDCLEMCLLECVLCVSSVWMMASGDQKERGMAAALNVAPEGNTAHHDRHKRMLVGRSL